MTAPSLEREIMLMLGALCLDICKLKTSNAVLSEQVAQAQARERAAERVQETP